MRTRSRRTRSGGRKRSPGSSSDDPLPGPLPRERGLKIALLAGDGIGPEILREAVRILDLLRREGLSIETEEALVGGAAYDAHGDPLPPKTLDLAKKADAVLFGAVGGPKYDKLARDKRPERAILDLRRECDFFSNLPPAQVFPELAD